MILATLLAGQSAGSLPPYEAYVSDVDTFAHQTRTVAIVEFVRRVGPYRRNTETSFREGMIDEFRVLNSVEPEPETVLVLTSIGFLRGVARVYSLPKVGCRYLLLATKPNENRLPYAFVDPRSAGSVALDDPRERWGYGLFETQQTRVVAAKDPAFTAFENVVRTLFQGSTEQTKIVSGLLYQFSQSEFNRENPYQPPFEKRPRRDVEVLERLALEFPVAGRVPFYGALSRSGYLKGYEERFYQALFASANTPGVFVFLRGNGVGDDGFPDGPFPSKLYKEYISTLAGATNDEVAEMMARQIPYGPAPDQDLQRKISRFLKSKNERTVSNVTRCLAWWN